MADTPGTEIKKRPRGRPPKADVEQRKTPGRVGRPPGTAAIMNEYKARMLASPKSKQIIQKVMDTALEDGHPHQAACMKMVWDRVLPASWFEKEGKDSAPKVQITINNDSGSVDVSGKSVDSGDAVDAVDAEYSEVSEYSEVTDV